MHRPVNVVKMAMATRQLQTRISTLEKNVDKIIDIQGELKQLMEEYCDSTFSIEKTSYQVCLIKA